MYSIVETAIANKVNPYTYIKYLIEKISPLLDSFENLTDRSCLKDMVPWSDAFREYELECKDERKRQYTSLFPKPEVPKPPKKGTSTSDKPKEDSA